MSSPSEFSWAMVGAAEGIVAEKGTVQRQILGRLTTRVQITWTDMPRQPHPPKRKVRNTYLRPRLARNRFWAARSSAEKDICSL